MIGRVLNLLRVLGRSRLNAAVFAASFLVIAALELAGIGSVPLFVSMLAAPDLFRERFPWAANLMAGGAPGTPSLVAVGGTVLVIFFFVKNAALVGIAIAQSRALARLQSDLSTHMLSAYLARPFTYHLGKNSAELVRNTTGMAFNVVSGVVTSLCTIGTESLVATLIVIALLATYPVPALLSAVLIGGFIAVSYRFFKESLSRQGARANDEATEMIKWVNQSLGGIKEVKILGREGFFVEQYSHHVNQYSRANLYGQMLAQMPRYVIEFVVVAAMVAVSVALVGQGRSAADLLSALALFGAASIRLMPSANRIWNALATLRAQLPALEIIERDVGAESVAAPAALTAARPMIQGMVLERVSYTYPGASTPALAEVGLSIPAGVVAAVIGRSGAGKSTLVDIVLGLHTPDSGVVRVDGRDIAGDLPSWRAGIGYVPQSIFLSDDSVARNVAFGLHDADIDESRVWRALSSAQLDEFIRALPAGLGTVIGERGARLSGGQKQRIGIARALYRDPSLLVLDEATSSLDTETEREFARVLAALKGKTTVLVIAHRLETIRMCERLFLLDSGRLVASGSYAELQRDSAAFRRMLGFGDVGTAIKEGQVI